METLAGGIGERHTGRPEGLAAAVRFIEDHLSAATRQSYLCRGLEVHNIECEQHGTARPEEIVVVGAHYDTVPGTPGANDNGTGVAAVLALASRFRGVEFARTIRWVLFVNEEPPFFQGPEMGSSVYASRCRTRGENVAAMLSLETIGCYSDLPGSQSYPFPAAGYPDRGNFLGFVSDFRSEPLLKAVTAAFRNATSLPAESLAGPTDMPGVAWSDHWSFWQYGYKAVMVTDTAPWRYPHYHLSSDTPEKIDYVRLASAVEGVGGVIEGLCRGPAIL